MYQKSLARYIDFKRISIQEAKHSDTLREESVMLYSSGLTSLIYRYPT